MIDSWLSIIYFKLDRVRVKFFIKFGHSLNSNTMKINKTIYAALAVLFTCLVTNARAQNSLFTIEHEKVHVLYTYIDNPIKVTGTAKIDSLAIEGGGKSSVTKGEGASSYIVRVSAPGMAKLNVYAKGKIVDSREYRVKVLPAPYTAIGTRGLYGKDFYADGDSITVKEISKLSSIRCYRSDFEYDGENEVTGFVIDKISKEGTTSSLEIKGESISNETVSWLMDVQPGSKIFFRNVKADVLGSRRTIQSVQLIVK